MRGRNLSKNQLSPFRILRQRLPARQNHQQLLVCPAHPGQHLGLLLDGPITQQAGVIASTSLGEILSQQSCTISVSFRPHRACFRALRHTTEMAKVSVNLMLSFPSPSTSSPGILPALRGKRASSRSLLTFLRGTTSTSWRGMPRAAAWDHPRREPVVSEGVWHDSCRWDVAHDNPRNPGAWVVLEEETLSARLGRGCLESTRPRVLRIRTISISLSPCLSLLFCCLDKKTFFEI